MREILFRGKHMHVCQENKHLDGTWIEGYLADGNHINDGKCEFLIDPETICQYTGLTDKNGKKIWEGDIVGYWDTYSTENGLSEADCVGEVVWDDETMSFQVTNRLSAESYEVLDECSVIGNVFDNPKLLEV